jgi:membrane protease YdiL (CAAX protease family)
MVALLIGAKNVVIGFLPDGLGSERAWALFARNGAAVGVVVLVTLLALRSGWLVGLGLPRSGGLRAWVRAGSALGTAVMAVVVADVALLSFILVAASGALLIAVWRTSPQGRDEGTRWAVTPACFVLVIIAMIRTFRHEAGLDVAELGAAAIGTGLFEELIFRGGLQSLAIRARHGLVRVLVPGLAFGAWHVIDGIRDAQDLSVGFAILFVAGTVVATAASSWMILEPLRLRSRSILGPAFLHAAVNCGLLSLGLESTMG